MKFLRDRGFVLRRINFGDSDRYITIFSKNNGKLEVVAKGVRKITSRRGASLELLNLIEFQTVKSSKNYILAEVQLVDSFNQLKKELKYIREVFLMCELIDAIMPYGVKHIDVFDLMNRALSRVLDDEKTMVYFQVRLLSMLGFWDGKNSFRNEDHVRSYMEQILERKLKTRHIFNF